MAFLVLVPVVFLPNSLLANDERILTGKEILRLLVNSKVAGKGFQQTFGDPRGQVSASTTYWEGNNQSLGRWNVQGNRYCSQWGQNASWACYKVAVLTGKGEISVIWIDESGRRFEGILQSR